MLLCSLALPLCTVLLGAGPLLAQNTPPPTSNAPLRAHPGRRVNAEPCWQLAGIDKSVMEQRSAIERDTHSQVEGVCSNSSLSPQQKRQQIREIRTQAHQKMEGMITAEQQNALTSCQQQRSPNRPGNAGSGARGDCGEMAGTGLGAGGTSKDGSGNPPPDTQSPPQN
jgi:hypothetical protein